MEMKNYPIYATIWHAEFQQLYVQNKSASLKAAKDPHFKLADYINLRTKKTSDEISYRISHKMYSDAKTNMMINHPKTKDFV